MPPEEQARLVASAALATAFQDGAEAMEIGKQITFALNRDQRTDTRAVPAGEYHPFLPIGLPMPLLP